MPGQKKSSTPASHALIPNRVPEVPEPDLSSSAVLPTIAPEVPEPGLYWVLKQTETGTSKTGGYDFYILKQDGGVVKISQPSGKEEPITEKEEIEKLMKSFKNQSFADKTDTITTTISSRQLLTEEQMTNEKMTDEKMNTIKLVHSCFGGHKLATCGFTTLLSALALLGKAKEKDGFVTIEIDGFKGEIKLNKSTDVDTDDNRAIQDFENRKIFAEWLENNKEEFEPLSSTLFVRDTDNEIPFDKIIKIAKKKEIGGYEDYLTQEQAFGIYEVVKSVSEATKTLKDEAENQKLKNGLDKDKLQEYGMKINWDNITVDDLAILALLSAFLVVIAGPGAIAGPVALAAFRTLSLEIGWKLDDDRNLNKIDQKPSSTSPSKPEGEQLGNKAHGVNNVAVA